MEPSIHPESSLVALIGDTHDTIVGSAVFDLIRPTLTGADLILHCGDLSRMEAFDSLGGIAPMLAVRSTTDPEAQWPSLVDGPRQVVVHGEYRIEVRNKLEPEDVVERSDVDLVVYSAHHPKLHSEGLTVYLSPGSPALSQTPTVALLDLTRGGRGSSSCFSTTCPDPGRVGATLPETVTSRATT